MKSLNILVVGLFSVASLWAQVATGRITGRVSDPSGGIVAGATVKAVNILTNVEVSTKSTSDGFFDIPNLIPGQYRLEVEMAGFEHYQLRDRSSLRRRRRPDAFRSRFEVGAQTESVTVSSGGAAAGRVGRAPSARSPTTRRLEELPVLPASNPFVHEHVRPRM